MPEESSNNTPTPSASAAEDGAADAFESRRARHAHRRDATPWLGGVILIVLGLIFLAQNFGVAAFNNWWAVFILIPAVGAFTSAWRKYQVAGSVTAEVLGSLIGGVAFTAVALIFLFNLDVGPNANLLWPLLLIVGGVALLLQALPRSN